MSIETRRRRRRISATTSRSATSKRCRAWSSSRCASSARRSPGTRSSQALDSPAACLTPTAHDCAAVDADAEAPRPDAGLDEAIARDVRARLRRSATPHRARTSNHLSEALEAINGELWPPDLTAAASQHQPDSPSESDYPQGRFIVRLRRPPGLRPFVAAGGSTSTMHRSRRRDRGPAHVAGRARGRPRAGPRRDRRRLVRRRVRLPARGGPAACVHRRAARPVRGADAPAPTSWRAVCGSTRSTAGSCT